jgi:hypothetical protein
LSTPARALPRSSSYQSSAISFGLCQAVGLGGDAVVLTGQIGRALPAMAVLAHVGVDLAAHDGVVLAHGAAPAPETGPRRFV